MSLVRSKYRPAAIEPELLSPNFDNSLSLQKKLKEPDIDPYANIRQDREEPVFFLVSFTQRQRTEVLVTSEEESLRKLQKPTIFERIELQKEWTKKQLKDARIKSQKEAMIKLEQKRLNNLKRKTKNGNEESESQDHSQVDNEEDNDKNNEENEIMEQALKELQPDAEDDHDEEASGGLHGNNKEYLQELLEIKERKILSTRDCHHYHKEMTTSGIWRLAFKYTYGPFFGFDSKDRNKDFTQIFPWLLIGRKELSSNLPTLLKLGVTHILNVTHDVPNLFPTRFVYQRIGLKDNLESDFIEHFPTIVEFIHRVEKCRGRILVHCTAGSSRAPTAVISYLIVKKKIPLVDAYNYVRTLRPLVRPNTHFLYQLAMLEVDEGEGCSVYYHKDWRFYEFNVFRSVGIETRENLGTFRSIIQLYTKVRDENDLLS